MPKAKVVNEGLVDSWGRRNRLPDDRVCHACGESYRPKNQPQNTAQENACGQKMEEKTRKNFLGG